MRHANIEKIIRNFQNYTKFTFKKEFKYFSKRHKKFPSKKHLMILKPYT